MTLKKCTTIREANQTEEKESSLQDTDSEFKSNDDNLVSPQILYLSPIKIQSKESNNEKSY